MKQFNMNENNKASFCFFFNQTLDLYDGDNNRFL